MTLEDRIKDAMRKMLVARGVGAAAVLGWEEKYTEGWRCGEGTCWEDGYSSVIIEYVTPFGLTNKWDYFGKFGELIQELSEID